MEQPVISFKSFTFQYFSQAEPTLYDINLDIMPGEKILIVGPSGCGKSTLGRCLNGLIPFAYKGKISGSLTIKGKETKNESIFALSKNIGTVLQDSDGQFVGLNVGEDIAFALEAIQDPVSLYEPVYHDDGDAIYVMDQVRDDKDCDDKWLDSIAISKGLDSLAERERRIIELRFFHGRTQMEVADEIGISQAQVSRLEKSALKSMRKYV